MSKGLEYTLTLRHNIVPEVSFLSTVGGSNRLCRTVWISLVVLNVLVHLDVLRRTSVACIPEMGLEVMSRGTFHQVLADLSLPTGFQEMTIFNPGGCSLHAVSGRSLILIISSMRGSRNKVFFSKCLLLLLLLLILLLLLLRFNWLRPSHSLGPNCFQGIDSSLLLHRLLLRHPGVASTNRLLNRNGAEIVSGEMTVDTSGTSSTIDGEMLAIDDIAFATAGFTNKLRATRRGGKGPVFERVNPKKRIISCSHCEMSIVMSRRKRKEAEARE